MVITNDLIVKWRDKVKTITLQLDGLSFTEAEEVVKIVSLILNEVQAKEQLSITSIYDYLDQTKE